MIKTFNFNPDVASRADSSGGIRESGKYILTIGQCSWRKGQSSNSEMLDFVLTDGTSKALTRLITAKKDGSEAFGMKIFQTMLGLAGVQSAHVVEGEVYQISGGKEKGYRVKEIERKKLGFVLQYVEDRDADGYQVFNDKGWPKYRMEIRAVFDPATGKTFGELKAGQEAKRIVQILSGLEDDCAKVKGAAPARQFESKPRQAPALAPQQTAESLPEDIPF